MDYLEGDGNEGEDITANLKTIKDYALSGVDYISVGALTHSIKNMDLSLKAINQL